MKTLLNRTLLNRIQENRSLKDIILKAERIFRNRILQNKTQQNEIQKNRTVYERFFNNRFLLSNHIKNASFLFVILFVSVFISSCTSPKTLCQQYPKMYEEKPLSIAIMPPINQTTHVEAKDIFYTTLYVPLCEKGYYVFSPNLTMEMFQQESAYDAEMFLEGNLTPFRDVLGADAVMFTIIKDWQRANISGMISVQIEYILRSTKSGDILYSREGKITLDTSLDSGTGGWGILVDLVATAINTAATDKVVAGRKCNVLVLSDMPCGKYSPDYGKDQNNPAGEKFVKATIE